MALFQRKPVTTSGTPAYTIGANTTYVVIGLGNPGRQYQRTRHNIGFEAVDYFAAHNDFPGWVKKKDLKAEITSANLGDSRVVLVKPTTFMNTSGQAVRAVQHFYKVDNRHTLAVYDELSIPIGQLRTRVGGADAGHNGVKSLITHLGADFGRLRLGVGTPTSAIADAATYVLGKFTHDEQLIIKQAVREASALITEYVYSGSLPHDTRSVV